MKLNRKNLFLAAAIAVSFSSQFASAVTLYWDGSNGTSGFGSASGTWAAPTTGTATSGWSSSSTGVTAISGNSVTTGSVDILNFGTDTATFGLGGGTITVSGTVQATQLRFGSQTTSNVLISGGTINFAAAGNIQVGAGGTTAHTISSNITGAGTSLTKTGNSLVLSGANSYTGSTIISTGILTLGSTGALGGSNPGVNGTSTINIGSGATLSSGISGANPTNTISAPITMSGAGDRTLRIGQGAASNTHTFNINGAIGGSTTNLVYSTGTGSFSNGSSLFVLGAAGTYTGNTSITTGNGVNNPVFLQAGTGIVNALPATTVLSFAGIAGGGSGRVFQYDMNGNNQTLAGLTNTVASLRTQRVTNTGALATLTINNTTDMSFGGSDLTGGNTNRAQLQGAIALTKSGAGTFTLGGTLLGGATAGGNTHTGETKITAGILVLGETTSLQNSPFNTGTSVLGDTTNGLRAGVGGSGITTLTLGGLTGGNNFSTRFTSTTGGYTNLSALTLNPVTGATHSYSGDVGNGAGAMTLTKSGEGTQILAGTNTHTGATAVNAGTLVVNGNISTSNVTVSGTGTLKGSGTIVGSVTVNSGGTLASGTSIESLATGALSLTNLANFQYELDKDAAANVAGDLTAVTGNLSLAGTVNLSFLETGAGAWELGTPLGDHFGTTPADKLTLISYSGTWNGGLFTYLGNSVPDDSGILINGQQWWFNYNDTDAGTNFSGDLTGTTFVTMTVPEPNVAALIGGLGGILLLRRRR